MQPTTKRPSVEEEEEKLLTELGWDICVYIQGKKLYIFLKLMNIFYILYKSGYADVYAYRPKCFCRKISCMSYLDLVFDVSKILISSTRAHNLSRPVFMTQWNPFNSLTWSLQCFNLWPQRGLEGKSLLSQAWGRLPLVSDCLLTISEILHWSTGEIGSCYSCSVLKCNSPK